MEISKLKKLVEKTLNINKAKEIVSIDLKGKSYIADYMIVASGTSSRHIQSLSEILLSILEKKGFGIYKSAFFISVKIEKIYCSRQHIILLTF